jgi:phosphomevalonate kinase
MHMNRFRTSAPGKLVLSGEYAVLDGAAAIAVALDHRALVSVAPGTGDSHTITAPGYREGTARFVARDDGIQWADSAADHALFEAIWTQSGVLPAKPLDFTLDTSAFRDAASGSKFGTGSSAALSAALATALHQLGGRAPRAVALLGHRRFQGGSGSGVDIATSLSGGVIRFRLGDDLPGSVDWPDGLLYAVFWSGTPADTRSRIEHLGRQARTTAGQRLIESADRFADVFSTGNADDVAAELGVYCESLRSFDVEHSLDIYVAGHGTLADSAPDFGVVYKPCGAGGGDIGIALATSAASLASFAAEAERTGFRRLDVAMDSAGAMLMEEDRQ